MVCPIHKVTLWMVCGVPHQKVTLWVVHGVHPTESNSMGSPWCAHTKSNYGWSMVCPIWKGTLWVVHGVSHMEGNSMGGSWCALYGR